MASDGEARTETIGSPPFGSHPRGAIRRASRIRHIGCRRRRAFSVSLLLLGNASAAWSRHTVSCPTIREALATGKTADQLATEMDLSVEQVKACMRVTASCQQITAASADGKGEEPVTEMNVAT